MVLAQRQPAGQRESQRRLRQRLGHPHHRSAGHRHDPAVRTGRRPLGDGGSAARPAVLFDGRWWRRRGRHTDARCGESVDPLLELQRIELVPVPGLRSVQQPGEPDLSRLDRGRRWPCSGGAVRDADRAQRQPADASCHRWLQLRLRVERSGTEHLPGSGRRGYLGGRQRRQRGRDRIRRPARRRPCGRPLRRLGKPGLGADRGAGGLRPDAGGAQSYGRASRYWRQRPSHGHRARSRQPEHRDRGDPAPAWGLAPRSEPRLSDDELRSLVDRDHGGPAPRADLHGRVHLGRARGHAGRRWPGRRLRDTVAAGARERGSHRRWWGQPQRGLDVECREDPRWGRL